MRSVLVPSCLSSPLPSSYFILFCRQNLSAEAWVNWEHPSLQLMMKCWPPNWWLAEFPPAEQPPGPSLGSKLDGRKRWRRSSRKPNWAWLKAKKRQNTEIFWFLFENNLSYLIPGTDLILVTVTSNWWRSFAELQFCSVVSYSVTANQPACFTASALWSQFLPLLSVFLVHFFQPSRLTILLYSAGLSSQSEIDNSVCLVFIVGRFCDSIIRWHYQVKFQLLLLRSSQSESLYSRCWCQIWMLLGSKISVIVGTRAHWENQYLPTRDRPSQGFGNCESYNYFDDKRLWLNLNMRINCWKLNEFYGTFHGAYLLGESPKYFYSPKLVSLTENLTLEISSRLICIFVSKLSIEL